MASSDDESYSDRESEDYSDSESEDYYGFAENPREDEEQQGLAGGEEQQQGVAGDEEQQQGVAGDEEQQQGLSGHEEQQQRVRKARSATKWPLDKMTVTEIDDVGMLQNWEQKLRLRRLAGLIARQRLSLVMPSFSCLSLRQKWSLFDMYVMPWLHFPPEMKNLAFRCAMKMTAKSWRTHKSNLVRKFLDKGLEPFEKHPYVEPTDWNEFVQFRESEKAQAASQKFRQLRKRLHDHNMGPVGYDGKIVRWEKEDRNLSSKGIHNPWEEFPDGRSRNWLRARSELAVSDGTAEIRWKKESTQKVSQQVKEKNENALSSGLSWERENDLLSACLGPEQPGRVRGLSSYHGWKRAWPECSGVSRKRKRDSSVDVDAIKAELRAELTQDILSMLASQGKQLQPFSRGPSPAPGWRSSCASASAADICASTPPMPEDASCFDDTIDCLTEPTPCSLVTTRGGYQMEVAKGLVYPQQTILHSVLILFGYAVVKVEMVIDDAEDIELVPPPNDEIRTLGEAILQRIQWKRSCIVVNRISSEKPSERVPQHSSPPLLPKPPQDSRKSPCVAAFSAPLLQPEQLVGPPKSASILPEVEASAGKNLEIAAAAGTSKMSNAAKTSKKPAWSSQKHNNARSPKKQQPAICSQKAANASSPNKQQPAIPSQKDAADSKKQQPANGPQKLPCPLERLLLLPPKDLRRSPPEVRQ